MEKPQFDIILFGATSFVGRIVAKQLQALAESSSSAMPHTFSWAIAARSQTRLEDLQQNLGPQGHTIPTLIADANDEAQLRSLCDLTRVIISTVGPYALYGEALVKVCAETGTDYCDLTGEVHWIKRMLDCYETSAVKSGARIVNCCGFDSIPSDLGVFFLQNNVNEQHNNTCDEIKMGVKALRGGASGGTIASMINVAKESIANKNLRQQLANPYLICPAGHPFHVRQPNQSRFDTDFNCWTAPFVMAGINTRIVHRSNALLKNFYGTHFRYSEEQLVSKGGRWGSVKLRLGLVFFLLLIALPPTRWLLQKFVLPKPGQGPTEEQQRKGYFELLFIGKHNNKELQRISVHGQGDPGYSSTAKMLCQAALCLAFDNIEVRGGFYTPSALFGKSLIERLEKHAEIKFFIEH